MLYLRKKFNTSTHGDAGLTAIADRAEVADLMAMTPAERAKLLKELSDSLHETAQRKNLVLPASRFFPAEISRVAFGREISLLEKINSMFSFSPTLHLWADTSRARFIEALRQEKPYSQFWHEWEQATRPGRLDMLRGMMELQRRIYSANAIDFKPVPVEEAALVESLGRTQITYVVSGERVKAIDVKKIMLDERLLASDKMDDALMVAHHERMHAFIAQLAGAACSGQMKQDHLLYSDARNFTEKVACTGGVLYKGLPLVYQADPEEALCKQQEWAFHKEYSGFRLFAGAARGIEKFNGFLARHLAFM
jgi:hypothetical protein